MAREIILEFPRPLKDEEKKLLCGYKGEVVRCKDCKYYIAGGCDECVLMSAKSIIAGINNKRWYSDFYCAWGERREDATD